MSEPRPFYAFVDLESALPVTSEWRERWGLLHAALVGTEAARD